MPKGIYGEARRIRYFSMICHCLIQRNPIESAVFRENVRDYVIELNKSLNQHQRSTGILQTLPVAKNYLSYSNWLNMYIKDSNFIRPNGNTIYFANICDTTRFNLTEAEKISYFIHMSKKEQFKELFSLLKPSCSPKDFIPMIGDEHIVETILEWLTDLNILRSFSKKFGKYSLNYKFSNLVQLIKTIGNDDFINLYCSCLLGKNILVNRSLNDQLLWKQLITSLYKTKEYTRSEIDRNLYSALPCILDFQVQLILKYQTYMSLEAIIDKIQEIALNFNSFFTWNYMKQGGQLKIGV